jgi:3-dehydroquinate dehydratase / shikimate dehydrogenase
VRELYGIVGGSVSRSLAPDIQNTAFRALGLSALYLPFSAADFARFWREVVQAGVPTLDAPLRGLTVVRPHKEAALSVATRASERARGAGAANLLVRNGQGWWADTTSSVVEPLRAAGLYPTGSAVAVVGCGGAGRSVAQELRDLVGADVRLVNRSAHRGEYASRLLGLPWVPLAGFSPQGFDLVVNATPVVDEPVFSVAELSEHAIVVDLAYRTDSDTGLIAAARDRGHPAVDGRQILLAEVGRQFELFCERPLPPEAVRVALGNGREAPVDPGAAFARSDDGR